MFGENEKNRTKQIEKRRTRRRRELRDIKRCPPIMVG
jgi:hypothetical protein